MNFALDLQPTASGVAFAAAAVAVGAPLFSDGVRSLRLHRAFRRLKHAPLADAVSGLVHVRGAVALESPLFAPLSGVPCAGFRLEIRSSGGFVGRPIESFRPFRVSENGTIARVVPDDGQFDLSETARRDIAPGDQLSERLGTLLERTPEAAWLRRGGATLTLVERALASGAACHVVGYLRHSRIPALAAATVLERTGTDDAIAIEDAAVASSEPDCWINAGEHLSFLLVTDREPAAGRFDISPLRMAGTLIGPALSLLGLLYLANAADRFRALGS
jgi:hypothetical protein